eukprot:5505228-Pleurochrysis_carterae.AAC.2
MRSAYSTVKTPAMTLSKTSQPSHSEYLGYQHEQALDNLGKRLPYVSTGYKHDPVFSLKVPWVRLGDKADGGEDDQRVESELEPTARKWQAVSGGSGVAVAVMEAVAVAVGGGEGCLVDCGGADRGDCGVDPCGCDDCVGKKTTAIIEEILSELKQNMRLISAVYLKLSRVALIRTVNECSLLGFQLSAPRRPANY